MNLTSNEIFSQDKALEKSYNYLMERKNDLDEFIRNQDFASITYIGSGSSYCLCQSAEISTKVHTKLCANSIAAGDLMLNFPDYKNILENTLVVAPSRSGNTTEVVKSIKKIKSKLDIPSISISTNQEAKLSSIVYYNITFPWAFDNSVCQTRTVTNLYMIQLFLLGIISHKEDLINEIGNAVNREKKYIDEYRNILKEIGRTETWKKVVVLGDSELGGIAAEGAIAFKEIPQIPSNYYHLLDVRHGPMVLIDDNTLVIMASTPYNLSYQQELVNDLKKKGAIVITVGSQNKEDFNSYFHIKVPEYKYYGVSGIHFIYVPQVIAYYKAVINNINPDKPESLDPWIEL